MSGFHRLSLMFAATVVCAVVLLLSGAWNGVDGAVQIPFQIHGGGEAVPHTSSKVRHFYVGWPTLGGGHPKENPPVRLIITAPTDLSKASARRTAAPVIVFLSGMFG